MKKNLFLTLVASVLMFVPFASCGGDDNGGGGEDDVKNEVILGEPATAQAAIEVEVSGSDVIIPDGDDPLEEPSLILKTFEATEDSKAIIGGPFADFMAPAKAKRKAGSSSFVYRIYDYTVSGNVYTLKGFGTITVEGNGKSVTLTIKPLSGEELKAEGKVESQLDADNATTNLCRNWSVSATRISVKLGVAIAQDFTGCNISEIINYLTGKGIYFNEVDDNLKVTNVSFTKAGTFFITYANGGIDMGSWRWTNKSNGEIAYSWNGADMGNPLTSASVGGLVEFPSKSSCYLSLGTDVIHDGKSYRATMRLTLKD